MGWFKPEIQRSAMKTVAIVVLVPIAIAVAVNLGTREKTEITLRLESWIMIGSVSPGELSNLQLKMGGRDVKNILKVSWGIANTGDKGISKFETGPSVVSPNNCEIVATEISRKSSLLRIGGATVVNHSVRIDSMGILNPGDYLRLDVFLKDVSQTEITEDYFKLWKMNAKSLDLSIVYDWAGASAQKYDPVFGGWPTLVVIATGFTAVLVLLAFYFKRQRRNFQDDLFHSFRKALQETKSNP